MLNKLVTCLNLLILTALVMMSCSMKPADMIIRNAIIVTMDDNNPGAEALAIHGNKIMAIGSNLMIEKYRTDRTTVIDARG
jgi:hypothetical protein